MKFWTKPLMIGIVSTGVLSGCATGSGQPGFSDVQELVQSRMGARVQWNQGLPDDKAVSETIESMVSEKLTVEQVVQIALLNNLNLQATFEDLGIAQANLVEAGLLKNPVFDASVRFSDSSEESTNTEFAVSQDFLDILFIPLRKGLAKRQFEQTKFHVGHAVLNLAADVTSAFYALQSAQEVVTLNRTVLQSRQAAVELANRQHKAGNINDLDLALEQAAFHQAKLTLARSEAEVLKKFEELHRLVGLSRVNDNWQITESLPQLPQQDEFSEEELGELALSQRLDFAAAIQEVSIFKKALSLERWGVIPNVEVGVNTELEPDGTHLTGPTFATELPLFDRNQAEIGRGKAELRKSQKQLRGMERSIQSEVRSAYQELIAARKMTEYYRDNVIPLQGEIVRSAQKHYNYMLKGVYFLLQSVQDEVFARRDYIESLRDYWISRTELERVVGGKLAIHESAIQPPTLPTTLPMESSHDHHMHGGTS